MVILEDITVAQIILGSGGNDSSLKLDRCYSENAVTCGVQCKDLGGTFPCARTAAAPVHVLHVEAHSRDLEVFICCRVLFAMTKTTGWDKINTIIAQIHDGNLFLQFYLH